jgi:hypothetical protein
MNKHTNEKMSIIWELQKMKTFQMFGEYDSIEGDMEPGLIDKGLVGLGSN